MTSVEYEEIQPFLCDHDLAVLAAYQDADDAGHPCGCTPTQECDRHYLDADRDFERGQDV